MPRHYKGNEQLKGVGIQVAWTPELMAEMVKCKERSDLFRQNLYEDRDWRWTGSFQHA